MRARACFFMILLFFGLGVTQVRAESDTEKREVAAALAWLSLVDSGNYSGSWNQSSAYFRGVVNGQTWSTLSEGVRTPLGKLVSRKVKNVKESNALPGVPDGKYAVITFQTEFEHKKSTVETVTFMLENDGEWRAAGYFIK